MEWNGKGNKLQEDECSYKDMHATGKCIFHIIQKGKVKGKNMRLDNSKKAQLRRVLGLTSALFLMMVMVSFLSKSAQAATSISVKEINYNNSTLVL